MIENMINTRFRKVKIQRNPSEISEEKALEKGIETIHEILLYTLIIGVPLYEMYKSSMDSKHKE